jgi:hypothetical protein
MTADKLRYACAIILIWAPVLLAQSPSAQSPGACYPSRLRGAYGFQLTGHITTSGTDKLAAGIGRLEFDGKGTVSGVSSVNFAGYYLGNPVTGTYEASADCSLTFKLQDTSGAWQQFEGKLTPDLLSANFHQTDSGATQTGTLLKVAPACTTAALAPRYSFSLSGNIIPMNPGEMLRSFSLTGTADPDRSGRLKLLVNGTASSGTISLDSDCLAQLSLDLPSGDTVALRGVLVEGGKRILAVQTDPGAAVVATFSAR